MIEIKLLKSKTVSELREKIDKFKTLGWKELARQEPTMQLRYGQESPHAGNIWNWAVVQEPEE